MNAIAPAEHEGRRRTRLKSYGRALARMVMSGAAVLLVLDVLAIIQ
ncbi:hypothetical protein [Streptomyces sp. NBC_00576]|nr:hypothetical protein [Streptomyces sp. NBC_00576]WUB72286.1 hypothetical protein OG734_20420 [Streptomyces sp. NBC_00576]